MTYTYLIAAFAAGAVTIGIIWAVCTYVRRRRSVRPAATGHTPDADPMLHIQLSAGGKPRLSIRPDALFYVQLHRGNTVFHYLEAGDVRSLTLPRTGIWQLEETLSEAGIRRYSRFCYINPAHIVAIRRDRTGKPQALLDHPGCRPIAVSPAYLKPDRHPAHE